MNVISKFIILPGMNNKKEEVDLWLQESEKYGLKHVEISMEFCWGIHTKKGQPVEDYNYELFDYAQKRALEMELILKKNPTSMAIMEKGIYSFFLNHFKNMLELGVSSPYNKSLFMKIKDSLKIGFLSIFFKSLCFG